MVNTGAGDLKAKAGQRFGLPQPALSLFPLRARGVPIVPVLTWRAENFLKTVEILSPLTDAQVGCIASHCMTRRIARRVRMFVR